MGQRLCATGELLGLTQEQFIDQLPAFASFKPIE